MRVEEVHFNHNTNSAAADALNIRKGIAGGAIQAPEWKRGYPAQPAAYASAALGPQVTVKARFSHGLPLAQRKVRAIDIWVPPAEPSGCFGWLIYWIILLLRALLGNVLGETNEQIVGFDLSGNSGLITFTLVNHKLKTSGVGIRTTEWKWQVYEGGAWLDFDTTQHKIYVILDVPNGPWDQNFAINNTQLPWTDALDKACSWALGATTKDEVAERITRAVNTQPNQSYTPATLFGFQTYHLSSYLAQLDTGSPFQLNCTDCADAVTTLSNLLGCDLFEGRFFNMVTRKFLTLNGNPASEPDWVTWSWGYHEICWLHQMGQNELIYDGCLQVDMDNNYTDLVHIALHPIKMQFGLNAPGDYRYRLIQSGAGTLENIPRRRSVD